MDLKGKAAIVTGSASGVGRATALRLAHKGCAVLINYSRKQEEAERLRDEISVLDVPVQTYRADVANDSECRTMVAAALAAFGRIDVVINNAGTTRFIDHNDLDGVNEGDWELIMGVNVRGPFQVTRAARPALEKSGDGCVINVSSIASLRPVGSSIPYCASKAALNSLTTTLARTLAPKIRVNAVAPGFIAGDWLKQGLGEGYELARQRYEKQSALGRVCEPDDVASVIMALVESAGLVTGQIIPVEAGILLKA
jgi:3-oxoacyl-[acyl-carrier protein] reductase